METEQELEVEEESVLAIVPLAPFVRWQCSVLTSYWMERVPGSEQWGPLSPKQESVQEQLPRTATDLHAAPPCTWVLAFLLFL